MTVKTTYTKTYAKANVAAPTTVRQRDLCHCVVLGKGVELDLVGIADSFGNTLCRKDNLFLWVRSDELELAV